MNPLAWLFVALGVFTAGFAGGIYVTRDHYKGVIAKEHLAQSTALLAWEKKAADSVAANDQLKTTLEVQHAQANEALNVLLSHPADRVRLPASPCRAVLSQVVPASAVPATIETGGILPTETERVLDADRFRTQGIIGEAERELTDCRVVKEWAAQ